MAAAEAAVKRAGDAVTDMAYFGARDDKSADYCQARVRDCDVYVGLIGLRYGSPVQDRPGVSYTELEFETATEARLPRLVFMLDEDAVLPFPAAKLLDGECDLQARQRTFRERLLQAGIMMRKVASPKELELELLQALQESRPVSRTLTPSVRLAPRPAPLFGREELLANLDALLSAGDAEVPPVVALYGLGGIGKTSVALEYTYQHLSRLGVAWQLAAEDQATLAAGFGELAAQLSAGGDLDVRDVRDPVASVHGALDALPAEWLLLFDNAEDPASVGPYLPPAGRGRVLVTTQNQNWRRYQALEVPVLDPGIAADFLVSRTEDPDQVSARKLAIKLGQLPLALEQAAAYVQAAGGSLADYLALFQQRRLDMMVRGGPIEYGKTVTTTWDLAFGRLEQSAPLAVGMLRLLAFCAPEAIPLRLLLQSRPEVAGRLGHGVGPVLVPLLEDLLAARDAVRGAEPVFAGHPGCRGVRIGAPAGAGCYRRSDACGFERSLAPGCCHPD